MQLIKATYLQVVTSRGFFDASQSARYGDNTSLSEAEAEQIGTTSLAISVSPTSVYDLPTALNSVSLNDLDTQPPSPLLRGPVPTGGE